MVSGFLINVGPDDVTLQAGEGERRLEHRWPLSMCFQTSPIHMLDSATAPSPKDLVLSTTIARDSISKRFTTTRRQTPRGMLP